MFISYLKLALHNIGRYRWRSFLTMLGVMVGVMSVVSIYSIGQGAKNQLTKKASGAGSDIITVRPGNSVTRDSSGRITKIDVFSILGGGSFNDNDLEAISKTKDAVAVPFGLLNGSPEFEGNNKTNVLVIGANEHLEDVLTEKLSSGSFYTEADKNSPAAVIGQKVAQDLFRDSSPLGYSMIIRGQKVIVRGVFEKFENVSLNPSYDYNNAVFLPYDYAKKLSGGQLQNFQVLVKPSDGASPNAVAADVNSALLKAHQNQADFSVLLPADTLSIASSLIDVLTTVIAGAAAISLIVGGIGIMNIMLVTVSERTGEIGIRKSIGASSGQILGQFLIEAMVLSGVGGILGIAAAVVVDFIVILLTNLKPTLSVETMAIAFTAALAVGTFFGLMPALRAARKDPIDALRRNI